MDVSVDETRKDVQSRRIDLLSGLHQLPGVPQSGDLAVEYAHVHLYHDVGQHHGPIVYNQIEQAPSFFAHLLLEHQVFEIIDVVAHGLRRDLSISPLNGNQDRFVLPYLRVPGTAIF